jgi:hypothetical protein
MADETPKDKNFATRFTKNLLALFKEEAKPDQAEQMMMTLATGALALRKITDENGEISVDAIKKLTPKEKTELVKKLDIIPNGNLSDAELSNLRDFTRLTFGKSVNSEISVLHETLKAGGVKMPDVTGQDQINNTTSMDDVIKTAALNALDTGSTKLVRDGGEYKEVHDTAGAPDKKLDSTELKGLPKHVLRGIFDRNMNGKIEDREYMNVKNTTGVDVDQYDLRTEVGEGSTLPPRTPAGKPSARQNGK